MLAGIAAAGSMANRRASEFLCRIPAFGIESDWRPASAARTLKSSNTNIGAAAEVEFCNVAKNHRFEALDSVYPSIRESHPITCAVSPLMLEGRSFPDLAGKSPRVAFPVVTAAAAEHNPIVQRS